MSYLKFSPIFKGIFKIYYIYHIFCFPTRVFKKILKILFLLIFSHRILGENKFKYDQQIVIHSNLLMSFPFEVFLL